MNTNNPSLNKLFSALSSIYSKDNGMQNSNLYIILNAYAEVLQDIQRIVNDTKNNTYLSLADDEGLQAKFGTMINFPKPPRLNTITNGDEIYRAILEALYAAFLNGSTVDAMKTGLSTVLTLLTIDESSNPTVLENNNVFFTTIDRKIQIPYNAISASGTPANPSDFFIAPSGLTITGYEDLTRTVNFTGDIPVSGQTYTITYTRDHSKLINTNWMNFINQIETLPLPYDLKTFEKTFQNPHFSFWWNTYNRDGKGVEIIDAALDASECGLVWRLPEKAISYINPYDGQLHDSCINLYDLSGSVYDINSLNKDMNPDQPQYPHILDYTIQVPDSPDGYYVRYSNNNSIFTALSQFSGSFSIPSIRKGNYIAFGASDYGTLDFFQKNSYFDSTDLFGIGTQNIWTNVANLNGYYYLNADYVYERPFSLHETVLFNENFQSGPSSLSRFVFESGTGYIHDMIGVPIQPGEDCLQLLSNSSGIVSTVYPIIPSGILISGNQINLDFFDSLSSGNTTYIDSTIVDSNGIYSNNIVDFRFGMYNQEYFYSVAFSGADISSANKNVLNIPREYGWHSFKLNIGSTNNNFINSSMDEVTFYNQTMNFSGIFGTFNNNSSTFSLGDSQSINMNLLTNSPATEFSYFDNFKISYYESNTLRPNYQYQEYLSEDWQGSYLNQSTVLSQRVFKDSQRASFMFELVLKGLQKKYLFIVKTLVNELKPAHTLADVNVETDYSINTNGNINLYSGRSDNWQLGDIKNGIRVTSNINQSDPLDLAGSIIPSGMV